MSHDDHFKGRHRVNNRRSLDSLKRREAVMAYAAANGGSVTSILEAVGVPEPTYASWRRREPEWAARFDATRRLANKGTKGYDGTFAGFRRAYLGMDTTWFQHLIIDAIEKARAGEVILILIPPGHGKTTLLEDWCTYKLVTDPSYRVTVGSETVDHGAKIVDRVRNRFEPDGPTPLIPSQFGPIAPEGDPSQVWGQRRFNVAQKRSSDERDFSMNCVGLTGRVQGTRCDLLLLDDMQDVKSIELSQKYYDIVTQSFLTRPEMFGRTVIIGTRVGEVDVYRKLIDAQIPDRTILIPAYKVSESPPWPAPEKKPKIEDPSTWAPEGIEFLWPEKYSRIDEHGAPMKGLERFRYAALRFRLKEQTWWRNYMQKPEAASSMTFDSVTLDAMKDPQRSVIADPRPVNGREDPKLDFNETRPVPIIISVDPAVGGGNGVMAVACRPKAMEVLSAHLSYGLTKYSQIIDLIEEDCHRYSTPDSVITVVVIEDKAFQKGLLQDDHLMELQRRFGFRIVPNTTGRDKADKDVGVPSLPFAITRDEITIPWADPVSQKEMHDLLDQLSQWRPGVDGVKLSQDLVMCLWFAYRQWRGIRTLRVNQNMDTGNWRTASSSLRPKPMRRISRRPPYRSLRGGRP